MVKLISAPHVRLCDAFCSLYHHVAPKYIYTLNKAMKLVHKEEF